MLEVALVANEHDDNVRVGMVPKFLQPPRHVDVRGMFRDIIHQQRTDCTTIVSIQDPREQARVKGMQVRGGGGLLTLK